MENSGFVAGTLVHTAKGLMPIQEIKIGDLVLSMDKNNIGKTVFKNVLTIKISPEKQRIISPIDKIFCTDNQLFWVQKHEIWKDWKSGWLKAESLDRHNEIYYLVKDSGDKKLPRYSHSSLYSLIDPYNIGGNFLVATNEENIALQTDLFYENEEPGNIPMNIVDFSGSLPRYVFTNDEKSYLGSGCLRNTNFIEFKPKNIENILFLEKGIDDKFIKYYSDLLYKYMVADWDENAKSSAYETFIYNIEVENTHNYFIEEAGIWVHDFCN